MHTPNSRQNHGKEIRTTIAVMIVTALFAGLAVYGYIIRIPPDEPLLVIQCVVILLLMGSLLVGNIVFYLSRLGAYSSFIKTRTATRDEIEEIYGKDSPPSICIMIPSYKEEHRVLKQTILSAALAEYPVRRVVILIDDPPECTGQARQNLIETREMIASIHSFFHKQEMLFSTELYNAGASIRYADSSCTVLAGLYEKAADLLDGLGEEFSGDQPGYAHVDRVFLRKVIQEPAASHRARAAALRKSFPGSAAIKGEIRRVQTLFDVDITSFERKLYDNLSHQSNKAMNLNSYISLLGGRFKRSLATGGKPVLLPCGEGEEASFCVPAADYLMSLDADSIVTSDYALRLTDVLEKNPQIAVAQTPYSAFPCAPGILERTAGATTDVQYIQHQGYSMWNAVFWVGANAVLRVKAMNDIRSEIKERGYKISIYIQDRTLIEDTGSTIDLAEKGWLLFNYPARLSYSATPPDFGSLIIQRRRWSNGGLLVFPSLVRYAVKSGNRKRPSFTEFLIRMQYLISPILTNGALFLLLFLPFSHIMTSNLLVLLVTVPYYYAYGRDLRCSGYGWADLPRVYALNLLLMPINIAGVFLSIRQAVSGKKSSFGRTPKIRGRTRTPKRYVLIQWGIFSYLLMFVIIDLFLGRYVHVAFCAVSLVFYAYGLSVMLPWREAWSDVRNTSVSGILNVFDNTQEENESNNT